MKEQFQKLVNLKPDIQAKLRLMERIEEKEMHKNKYRYIWKSAIVIVLMFGLFSIPFVQKNIGNEIEVKAKEVERLNKKIEAKTHNIRPERLIIKPIKKQ